MVAVAAIEPDAELMLRVKDGDAASFALLLERHRAPVIHFLYRMVQNQAVAEELAQEVFLRVYRARATYEPTAKFTTWLFRIATHLALNCLRDGRPEKLQESLDDDADCRRQLPDRKPDDRAGASLPGETRRSAPGDRRAAGQAARGRADAQVRGDGVFADRPGAGLLGIGAEIAAVPGL